VRSGSYGRKRFLPVLQSRDPKGKRKVDQDRGNEVSEKDERQGEKVSSPGRQ
jgi:hypothetical protein